MAESPIDENLIWVGTDDGNLQVTTDAGKTWTNVSVNISATGIAKQSWVSSIEPSRFNKTTVYATFENHMYGDMQTYVAVSSDLGKTWKRLQGKDFTGFAHKIREDLVNKDMLFLGTEMGLFATLDGGQNWFRMKNNIPEYVLARDIQIHPTTHDLIIASHGRGIFVVDDIRALRQLSREKLEEDVYLYPIPDITLNNGKFGWGGPEVSGGWYTGNPAEKPRITYYLKSRLNSGKVTIDILDDKGLLVQSLPGTIRKGINTVSWNLRGNPPKVAAGSTKMDGAGFTAPMVLPGEYTCRLKIKDREYTCKFNCVHDDKNPDLSLADRRLVYEKSIQLQNLYNKINGSIDTINKIQSVLKRDTVAFSKNKIARLFYDDLQKVKAELTATKKLSIFADEERLREKVSELYATFCGMESCPNNLQIEAIEGLEKDYKTGEEKLKKTVTTYLPKVKQLSPVN
jgi:hypothetical protein